MRPTPKEILHRAKKTALIVSNLTNIRYLTGLQLSSGLVLVTSKSFVLFVDSRYSEMAEQIASKNVTLKAPDAFNALIGKYRTCGIEADDVTVSQLLRWKKRFKKTKLVTTHGIIEHFRRQKGQEELRLIKRAHRITQEMLRRVPAALRVGIRETDLAWKLEEWARELGAEGLSFDAIVAFGPNSSRPHHHPTSKKLQKGHIVQIDVGAKYRGYCADRSMVFFTAPMTRVQKDALDAVKEAKETALAAVKHGVSVRELDRIARDVLKEHGMADAFTHSLGHGVGLDIHEGVNLSQRAADDHLLKNEVITIEPGVYFPGKFGIRLEDMVVVV